MKKFLFVFVLLFPGSVIHPRVVTVDHGKIFPGLKESFMILQTTDSTELPGSKLLETALSGFKKVSEEKKLNHPEVITIIDFGLPSDKERLWVIDLVHSKVLFHCLVSHGRNSGELMAEHFSNTPGSFASSPGFYITGETYIGKNGLSLTLDGIEKGINDRARERAIVMHGADYVSSDYIRKYGRLGRSHGCPAVPKELNKKIIQAIKGGSCLFIYVPKKSYLSNSQIIKEIVSIDKG
jgi:hypothetical protein